MNWKHILSLTLAGLLAAFLATMLCAVEQSAPPPSQPGRLDLPENWEKLTPAERKARVRELRERYAAREADAAKRPPIAEERRARIRAKLAELQKKQTEGTITAQEKTRLRQLEAAVKRLERPAVPATPKARAPVEKPADSK